MPRRRVRPTPSMVRRAAGACPRGELGGRGGAAELYPRRHAVSWQRWREGGSEGGRKGRGDGVDEETLGEGIYFCTDQ